MITLVFQHFTAGDAVQSLELCNDWLDAFAPSISCRHQDCIIVVTSFTLGELDKEYNVHGRCHSCILGKFFWPAHACTGRRFCTIYDYTIYRVPIHSSPEEFCTINSMKLTIQMFSQKCEYWAVTSNMGCNMQV